MLTVVPITTKCAAHYIRAVHRHHGPPQGLKFAVAVESDGVLVGVATAGRPVARHLDDGQTIEVTRVATDGTPNACSMLYGACWRAARAMGYRRAITYIQGNEPGTSLRAAGWRLATVLPGRRGWDTPARRRSASSTDGVPRQRWEIGERLATPPVAAPGETGGAG
jgi:hypothetical protein